MTAVKSHAGSGPAASEQAEAPRPEGGHRSLWALTLGSVGVVYGDIGTSPLYAFREALAAADQDGTITRFEVYGVLSLILWALVLIVTLKYVLILLRADNRGEGGTLALMALARAAFSRGAGAMIGLGIVGAALFYGDAIITPAISVLSAVEGLKLVEPRFEPFVLPITLAIIAALFLVQNRGTGRVAAFFGPITAVWFTAMGVAGAVHILDDPGVLNALNPWHGAMFMAEHGQAGLIALGAVFLAVTGAEALYADLGHFGRRPIRLAWFVLVLPALALNYLGQGALVLSRPEAAENPFFLLVPGWALVPMVLLATLATVIASQAVITGAFSLSRQAVQLGLLPRLEVRHTSEAHAGQIYVPQVNMMLFLGVVFLVMMFGNSGALASAYGIAVTGTMVVTVLMAFVVVWKVWKWPLAAAAAVIVPFLVIDAAFLAANLLKIHHGGWVPLLVAAFIVLVMVTWRRGSRLLIEKTRRTEVPLADLVRSLEKRHPHRVSGTAVFLTSDPGFAPTALMHNLKHNKVLHEHNVILTILSSDAPRVPESERVTIEALSEHFGRVTMQFGFVEEPNVPRGLQICRRLGWKFEILNTSFFLSRRSIRPAAKSGMPLWQDRLFIVLARNASDATDYFQIPTDRVVEIGMQVSV
jgi:KUP system potassium uptake protein